MIFEKNAFFLFLIFVVDFWIFAAQKLSDWKQSVSDWKLIRIENSSKAFGLKTVCFGLKIKLLSDWKQLQRYTKNSCFYFCSLKNTQRVPEKITPGLRAAFAPKNISKVSDWKQHPGFATSPISIGLDISKPTR